MALAVSTPRRLFCSSAAMAIIAYFIINKVMEKKEDPKRFDDLE
jgi:phage shock protein PspC (stress-responsive transcriptional regulator)